MPAKKGKPAAKATVKKRTLNPPGGAVKKPVGSPFNEQDVKRRLGNFESAGEHPRVGARRTGIVGQSTKRFKSERKAK